MEEYINIRNKISEIVLKYKYELSLYDNMDDKKKNIINSFDNFDDESIEQNLQAIDNNLTVNKVRLLLIIIKLRFWLSKNSLQDYYEYLEIFGQEDTDIMLKSELDLLLKMVNEVDVYENLIKLDNSKSSKTNNQNTKNFIIFLKSNNTDYFIEDLNDLLSTKRTAIKNIEYGLSLFSKLSIPEIRKIGTEINKKILPSEKIISYDDELKTHRLRHNDVRIAYCQVPLTGTNKMAIQNLYNNGNDINIILILGFKVKSDSMYDEFNARIAREIITIRAIKDLFSTDFTPERLRVVEDIFNQTNINLCSLSGNQKAR